MCLYVGGGCAHAKAYVWRSKDNKGLRQGSWATWPECFVIRLSHLSSCTRRAGFTACILCLAFLWALGI